ncbi:MAG TPA: hypothetical protein EYP22_07190 [Methanosarcinales archaeon]|nr:hypothetical protein [Methanosarcinales archaeon]
MIQSQILQEYIEKGIEKGKIEGKKEERLERLKKDVVSVLRARFNRVPRRLTAKIKKIKGYTKLEHLLKLAATSKDLDEFEKNIR